MPAKVSNEGDVPASLATGYRVLMRSAYLLSQTYKSPHMISGLAEHGSCPFEIFSSSVKGAWYDRFVVMFQIVALCLNNE